MYKFLLYYVQVLEEIIMLQQKNIDYLMNVVTKCERGGGKRKREKEYYSTKSGRNNKMKEGRRNKNK
jgi:hypothetical protein